MPVGAFCAFLGFCRLVRYFILFWGHAPADSRNPQTVMVCGFTRGPSGAARTPGHLLPKQARYQLRYTRLCLAPSTRLERVAFRLGGERSIQLSYEGMKRGTRRLNVFPVIIASYAGFVNQAMTRTRTTFESVRRCSITDWSTAAAISTIV